MYTFSFEVTDLFNEQFNYVVVSPFYTSFLLAWSIFDFSLPIFRAYLQRAKYFPFTSLMVDLCQDKNFHGAFMEQFIEVFGTTLRINPNEKNNQDKYSLLS